MGGFLLITSDGRVPITSAGSCLECTAPMAPSGGVFLEDNHHFGKDSEGRVPESEGRGEITIIRTDRVALS